MCKHELDHPEWILSVRLELQHEADTPPANTLVLLNSVSVMTSNMNLKCQTAPAERCTSHLSELTMQMWARCCTLAQREGWVHLHLAPLVPSRVPLRRDTAVSTTQSTATSESFHLVEFTTSAPSIWFMQISAAPLKRRSFSSRWRVGQKSAVVSCVFFSLMKASDNLLDVGGSTLVSPLRAFNEGGNIHGAVWTVSGPLLRGDKATDTNKSTVKWIFR